MACLIDGGGPLDLSRASLHLPLSGHRLCLLQSTPLYAQRIGQQVKHRQPHHQPHDQR